jgi:hypothetical protein
MIKIQSAGIKAALKYGLKPVMREKSRVQQGDGPKENVFALESGELRISWKDQRIEAVLKTNTDVYVREISLFFSYRSPRPAGETTIWTESFSDDLFTGRFHPVPSTLSKKPVRDGAWALWVSETSATEGLFFSQSPPASFPIRFSCHPGKKEIRIDWQLNRTVSSGSMLTLPAVTLSRGTAEKEIKNWHKEWAAVSRRETLTDRRTGWCAGPELTSPKELREMLAVLKAAKPRFEWFAVGPEYALATGDWLNPAEPFRDRMGSVSRSITEYNMGPALRLAPFLVSRKSELAAEKRDWLVRSSKGSPLLVPGYAGDREMAHVLDITHSEVIAHVTRLFTVMRDQWGFRNFVLERVGNVAVPGNRQNNTLGTGNLMEISSKTIRNAVGNKVLLIASDLPLLTSPGLWDSQALIPAIDEFSLRPLKRARRKAMTIASALLHRSGWIDIGWVLNSGILPLGLIEKECGTADGSLLASIALAAGIVILSGDPRTMNEESLKSLKDFLNLSEKCRKGKLRIIQNVGGGLVSPLVVRNDRGLLALFNLSGKKKGIMLDRTGMKTDLGVSTPLSAGDGAVFNSPEIHVALQPYGHRIFRT